MRHYSTESNLANLRVLEHHDSIMNANDITTHSKQAQVFPQEFLLLVSNIGSWTVSKDNLYSLAFSGEKDEVCRISEILAIIYQTSPGQSRKTFGQKTECSGDVVNLVSLLSKIASPIFG